MAQYICITNNLEEDAMEIPSEDDGTILLSTLQAQYPEAIGLKYKVESRYRAVKLADGKLYAPLDGWQDRVYFCTFDTKTLSSGSAGGGSLSKRSYPDNSGSGSVNNTDLVVLGIPWNFTDQNLKEYFEQFGTLEFANVKMDKNTGRSKGFGFIRFTSHESALKVMLKKHKIGNRICDVRIPESTKSTTDQVPNASKVFVGSLTSDITEEDLRAYFENHGVVKEVLVPKPFREFAFVTFESEAVAKSLIGQHVTIKDTNCVVMEATPKKKMNDRNDNWNNQNNFDRRNERSRSPQSNPRHYGQNQGGNGYYDNRQQAGGYNNKRRRNDYDDWHVSNNSAMTPDVLQAVVNKAVSEVLNVQKTIDPWRH